MKNDRWKDPEAWNCLSDEQRDIICEWWQKVNSMEREEQTNKEGYDLTASVLALIPFAVAYGFKDWNTQTVWWFLGRSIAALIVYGLIYVLAKNVFMHFYERGAVKSNKWRLVKISAALAATSLCVLSLIYK